MSEYLSILIFLFFILSFVAISLLVNRFFDIWNPVKKASTEPFECGATPIQRDNSVKVPITYYKLAIMFVLFDLEGIFLFLWAKAATPMTTFMFLTFLFFMLILFLLFFYVLREGVLNFTNSKGKQHE